MKGIRKKTLFYLQCSTVTDGVIVASHMPGTNDDTS